MEWKLKRKPDGEIFAEWSETVLTPAGKPSLKDGKIETKRRRVRLQTSDMRTAKERAPLVVSGTWSPYENKVVERPVVSEGKTVAELLDKCMVTIWAPERCRSQATFRSTTKILKSFMGEETLQTVSYDRLTQLVTTLREHNYAEATIRRKLNNLSAALGEATVLKDDAGKPWLLGRPKFPKIVVNNQRERVIEPHEEEAIFKAVDARIKAEPARQWKRYKCLLIFLRDTACRLGEALALKDVHIAPRTIQAEEIMFVNFPRDVTKNQKPKALALSDAILEILPYLEATKDDEGRLFPMSGSSPWYFWNTLRSDVKNNFGLNIDDCVQHSWRHTTLTRLIQDDDLDIYTVSNFAGHSNIQITSRFYLHKKDVHTTKAVKVINRNSRR